MIGIQGNWGFCSLTFSSFYYIIAQGTWKSGNAVSQHTTTTTTTATVIATISTPPLFTGPSLSSQGVKWTFSKFQGEN